MSTPALIIAKTRRLAKCTSNQYSDANAYSDLNDAKDEIWNKIVSEWISSNYNWDIWTTDSIALQTEYGLDIPTSSNPWQKTINNVYINYDWETYTETGNLKYIQCTEKDPKNLPYSWEYYEENQDKAYPIYFQKDDAIFIAPVPRSDEAWVNRIKLEWIRKIADWDANTTETGMKFPVDFHNVFVFALMPYALASKWAEEWIVNNAEVKYEKRKLEVISQMTQRIESPFFNPYPDDEPLDKQPN